jgi:hypothetical protein
MHTTQLSRQDTQTTCQWREYCFPRRGHLTPPHAIYCSHYEKADGHPKMVAPRSYCLCKRFPFNQNDLHADLCSECCLRWRIQTQETTTGCRDTLTWGVWVMQMTGWRTKKTADEGLWHRAERPRYIGYIESLLRRVGQVQIQQEISSWYSEMPGNHTTMPRMRNVWSHHYSEMWAD